MNNHIQNDFSYCLKRVLPTFRIIGTVCNNYLFVDMLSYEIQDLINLGYHIRLRASRILDNNIRLKAPQFYC